MKVPRFLLAIISSILLVNFSIRVYDEQIKIRFYNEIENYYETSLLFINEDEADRFYIIDTIINLANTHEVTVHVPFGDILDRVHYIYSRDQKILNSFILEGNRIIDYSGRDRYSSLSEDYNTRIFKPTKNGTISVYPLSTYISDNRNINGEYKIYSENYGGI